MRRTQKNREILTRLVQREVKRQLGVLGMATRDEVARLQQRVRALEQEIERSSQAASSARASGRRGSGRPGARGRATRASTRASKAKAAGSGTAKPSTRTRTAGASSRSTASSPGTRRTRAPPGPLAGEHPPTGLGPAAPPGASTPRASRGTRREGADRTVGAGLSSRDRPGPTCRGTYTGRVVAVAGGVVSGPGVSRRRTRAPPTRRSRSRRSWPGWTRPTPPPTRTPSRRSTTAILAELRRLEAL
jgi:hypothetical protein